MIKTIPLMMASLKSFMRNWKAIILLVVVPLLLVGLIFASFSPTGLNKIPIGAVVDNGFDIGEFTDIASYFADLTMFSDKDSCLRSLKRYQQYVCIEVIDSGSYLLNVYFDNTKEPVIWEVIARIEKSVEYIQKLRSKEIAEGFIGDMRSTLNKIDSFKQKLSATNQDINIYINEVRTSKGKLRNAKSDLSRTLDDMDNDINEAKVARNNAQRSKNKYRSEAFFKLTSLEYQINKFPESSIRQDAQGIVNDVENEISYYDREVQDDLNDVQYKIENYEVASSKGRGYVRDIDSNIRELEQIERDLKAYKLELLKSEAEVEKIKRDFSIIEQVDAEFVVNPIVVRNHPTYIPSVDEGLAEKFINENDTTAEKVIKGLNLISLQTIFPTLMLLIILFLSLLISSFVCLSEINSSANIRIKLIKNVFFHEFVSIFISSLIIVTIPFMIVMLLGNYVFILPIFDNFDFILLMFFLLCGSFILVGMGVSYFLKKESITLLITTFLLVFLIFFSGLLLPIERMTPFASTIASVFPGKVALNAFNKVILYGGGMDAVLGDMYLLSIWFIILGIIALLIKKFKNS